MTRFGVEPTADPSAMICMDPPRYGFAGLPPNEHVTAFRVPVSAFAIADAHRRQTYHKDTRIHAWHHLPTPAEEQ
ncbi:DUF5958 family protein [Streptomyces albidochromogenes]|uniref:DUF5958 family protein n=1 Tax=Streptomyces albidochromogenes TaxID=329524 RepID=A0ABW6FMQ4_9ACTN